MIFVGGRREINQYGRDKYGRSEPLLGLLGHVLSRLFRLLVWILVSRLNYEDCCSIAETRQMSFFHRFI